MTRVDEMKLIDDLINENPETTIRDYLDTRNEIDSITDIEPLMNELNEVLNRTAKLITQ